MISRREFVRSAGLAGIGATVGVPPNISTAKTPQLPSLNRPNAAPDVLAQNEEYWLRVAAYYGVSDSYTNLEAGYFGMMAAPVLAAFRDQVERVNRENSFYARRGYEAELQSVRARVASFLGAEPEEIVFTRGATEALQRLIAQYRRLKPGDVVMYCDLDYPAMQSAMNWLAERRGVTVERLTVPEPATRDNVLALYDEALRANRRVRLLLLTHLNNKTGLIIPVRELVAMARERGADVIVDAAHSFGQVDISLADLGADFVGLHLHKWLGAPIGAGVMYIKASRLHDVERMYADESAPANSIQSRVHTGTANFATYLTVPAALDFQAAVGLPHKAARLRYLRDRWVRPLRNVAGVQILTSDEAGTYAAITSFRLHGDGTKEGNESHVRELFDRYKLFTVARDGPARGDCVRVTPALYNTPSDVDRLAAAVEEMARRDPGRSGS
jgi:isopenicillin-N epimerase